MSNLWLTDRSRYEDGLIHCPRSRYLTYHAGPHGYGWETRARSLPTVTGTLVHLPIARILEALRTYAAAEQDPTRAGHPSHIPTDDWIYEFAITPAVEAYHQVVATRGLAAITDPEELALRTIEQTTLLEGLVWTFVDVFLPAFHRDYEILLVEVELPVVLGCTCGLGDRIGALEDHDARQCEGLGYMTKGDCVSRHRLTGQVRYDEFKTTADATLNWREAWQYRAQVLTGVLGAEAHLGVRVDEVRIQAWLKGSYRAAYNPETKSNTGPRYQQSPLVYGYRRAANLPLWDEDWAASLSLPPDPITGKGKRLGKEYQRAGVWELPADLWQARGALSPSHYWCRWLGAEKLAESYAEVGPLYREDWRLESQIRQIVAEERRVQVGVWAVYDALAEAGAYADDRVQAALDTHFPQAGGDACHSYFGSTCPKLGICKRADGWDDPARVGYLIRRPHHETELAAMTARGLAPAEWGAGDEGED